MTAPILDAFLERPREGLCAPNITNNISNSHRALVQKVHFWLPFGLHFGAFSGPFWLFWRSRGLSKIRCKKRLPKKRPRVRKLPKMGSQNVSHKYREAPPPAILLPPFSDMCAPRAPGCQNDAQMSQNCAKMTQKLSKNGAKIVPRRSTLTRQLSPRSPNKRCQEFCDSCALTASNRQATLQTHTRTHHTHPQYTHTAQQTRHSRHSTAHTAQHNPR